MMSPPCRKWRSKTRLAGKARRIGTGLILSLCLALLGCASRKGSGTLPSSSIDELHLLAMPLALNLDKSPGADGFAVKVYAVCRKETKTQPIRNGQLDILMFDGVVTVSQTNQPRRVWTYSEQELPGHLFQTTIGAGYAFTPLWGADLPRKDKITVAARYLPEHGPSVYSAASVVTVVSQ